MTVASQLPLVEKHVVPVDDDGRTRFAARWSELGGGDIEIVTVIKGKRWWIVARVGKHERTAIRATPEACADALFNGGRR